MISNTKYFENKTFNEDEYCFDILSNIDHDFFANNFELVTSTISCSNEDFNILMTALSNDVLGYEETALGFYKKVKVENIKSNRKLLKQYVFSMGSTYNWNGLYVDALKHFNKCKHYIEFDKLMTLFENHSKYALNIISKQQMIDYAKNNVEPKRIEFTYNIMEDIDSKVINRKDKIEIVSFNNFDDLTNEIYETVKSFQGVIDFKHVGLWLENYSYEDANEYWNSNKNNEKYCAITFNGHYVGSISLMNKNNNMEIGYYLHKDLWSKGITTKALILMCEKFDNEIDLVKAHVDNISSQKVIENSNKFIFDRINDENFKVYKYNSK